MQAQSIQSKSEPAKPSISLPKDKVKKKTVQHHTREQLDEMNGIYQICIGSPRVAYYNCTCAAIKYLDGLTKEGNNVDRNKLTMDSYLSCPDPVAAAGTAYQACSDWAKLFHPDPAQFCECYARRFSKLFVKNSRTFIRDEDAIRQTAMKECDFTGPIVREFNKEVERDKFLNP